MFSVNSTITKLTNDNNFRRDHQQKKRSDKREAIEWESALKKMTANKTKKWLRYGKPILEKMMRETKYVESG